ncbi:MAG TPA: terminase gpA endonuclease subunit [Allosphingosinicella sp.]|nr:terminase gpA endonuclease subunit [Allosphingosinicella sp.]
MLLDPDALRAEVERLAQGAFLCPVETVATGAPDLLTPPTRISTTECASKYRLIARKEGEGGDLWDPELTPFINPIQDALDDPDVKLVIVPKPARTGGTVAAENHLHKRLKFGPLTDVLWYLGSDSEVDAYCRRHVRPLFNLHPDIKAKIGPARSDDTMHFKVVGGRNLEWLQLNARTITGRDAGLIVGDEIDAANRKLRDTFVEQALIRGTTAGSNFKGYLCSHMDAGWVSGIAAAWKESSRGIWYWPCPHCGGHSSPCPTAPKGWRMKLDYVRLSGVGDDEMLEHVEATAGLVCPHCGAMAREEHKRAMLLAGKWVHEGQTIDVDGNVIGEPRSRRVLGFWIHGTMSPWVPWADLARRFVAALVLFERTKKPERLREVTAKVLGEVYEGGAAGGGVDPIALARRAAPWDAGTVPDEVRFVTAAVDVGHRKFDVMIVGWDLEGRSWIIDRFTITTRRIGGRDVDIRPAERQEDWLVLKEQVLDRALPLASDPERRMPIAGIAIDTGDGHVTWKAREFARRMARAGEAWGGWQRVRLIKGAKSPKAPELPVAGREINKDEGGKPVSPTVLEWDLGVSKLKELTLERLAEAEGGPGQVTFADGLPRSTFDEFAGEALIDGKWERRGPNESLDLFAYAEAVRLMLRPERADIRWDVRPPVWARPVAIEQGFLGNPSDPSPAPAPEPKKTIFERIDALNRNEEEQ